MRSGLQLGRGFVQRVDIAPQQMEDALLGRDVTGAPVMDARACISYLTIEHRGSIAHELRPLIGNRVFGCDICQEVCPWNQRFAVPATEAAYRTDGELNGARLVELAERLLGMDDHEFRAHFRGSAVTRAKRAGLLRNVCVALGNVRPTSIEGARPTISVLVKALGDPHPMLDL